MRAHLVSSRHLFLLLILSSNLSAQVSNAYLRDSNYVFISQLDYQENTFSGYLGLKYLDINNFRVSFNSAMGNTIMDLEWKDGLFIKHYIPEQLDKSIIINKLQTDFEMMMLHILEDGKWKNDSVLKVGMKRYYFYTDEQKRPLLVNHRNFFGRLKRALAFTYDDQERLNRILLKHSSFALQLELNRLEQ